MAAKNHFWIVPGLVCCWSVLAWAQTDPHSWEKLNLDSTTIAGATVYYEKSFEPNLPFFEQKYKEFLAEKDKSNTVDSDKEKILGDINSLLGITEPDTELLEKVWAGYSNIFSSIKNVTFYLVKQSTTKDFLRAGGTLPNFTYDKVTDMAEYNPYFEPAGKDKQSKNLEFAFPVSSNENFEKETTIIFQVLQDLSGQVGIGLVIHEIVELTILRQMSSGDPYKRWFSDGFANVITHDLLGRHYSQEEADSFIAGYSTEPYKQLENQLNLKYWMCAQFVFMKGWPIEEEEKLNYARYCLATEEAKRLVDAYGIEVVKNIIAEYKNLQEQETDSLYAVIKKVTGEDLSKRFETYQNFQTRQEGYAHYEKQYEQAMRQKNANVMIISMLRMLELCEQPLSQDSLNWRKNIATLLYLTGQKEPANQFITEFANFIMQSKDPQNRFVARHLVVLYALGIHHPEVAYHYARQTFEENPEEIHAMAIVMHQLWKENNIQKARELARKICTMEPNDKHPCHQMAKQVLSKTETK